MALSKATATSFSYCGPTYGKARLTSFFSSACLAAVTTGPSAESQCAWAASGVENTNMSDPRRASAPNLTPLLRILPCALRFFGITISSRNPDLSSNDRRASSWATPPDDSTLRKPRQENHDLRQSMATQFPHLNPGPGGPGGPGPRAAAGEGRVRQQISCL